MKKYAIVLMLFLFGSWAYAQTKTQLESHPNKVIELKFNERELVLNNQIDYRCLKVGEYYYVKVTGINQINYRVSVSQKDTLETPELKLPTFSDFNIETLTQAFQAVDFGGLKGLNILEGPREQMTNLSEAQKKFESEKNPELWALLKLAIDQLNKYESKVSLYNRKIRNEFYQIDDYYRFIKSRILKSRLNDYHSNVSLNDEISKADCIYNNIVDLRREIDQNLNLTDYLDNEIKIRNILISVDPEKLSQIQKKKFILYKEAFDELIKTKEKVLANQKILEENYIKTKEAISGEIWEKAMTSLSLIQNLQEPVYESLPIQYLGERSKVTINVTPRDPAYGLNSYSTTFMFPVYRVPYFGLSSSFYFSGLKSDVFSVIAVPDTTTYKLVNEKEKKQEIGTALLAKFGRKHNTWFGYHGSLGLGISFTDQVRPRVMAGGGFTLGTKNSLAIDFGVIAGQVDRLSAAYNDLSIQYPTPPEQVTVSVLEKSYFLAVGYFFRF